MDELTPVQISELVTLLADAISCRGSRLGQTVNGGWGAGRSLDEHYNQSLENSVQRVGEILVLFPGREACS